MKLFALRLASNLGSDRVTCRRRVNLFSWSSPASLTEVPSRADILQVGQVLDVLQPSVANSGIGDVQHLKALEAGQMHQAGIGDQRIEEDQLPDAGCVLQESETGIVDRGIVNVQSPEGVSAFSGARSYTANASVGKVQPLEAGQSTQVRGPGRR